MPGGGGDPLISAISSSIKLCHPGKSPKPSKLEKHLMNLIPDPVERLKISQLFFKRKCLYAYYLALKIDKKEDESEYWKMLLFNLDKRINSEK